LLTIKPLAVSPTLLGGAGAGVVTGGGLCVVVICIIITVITHNGRNPDAINDINDIILTKNQ